MNDQKEQHRNPEKQFWRQKNPKVSHVVACRWVVDERRSEQLFSSVSYASQEETCFSLPVLALLSLKAKPKHTHSLTQTLCCLGPFLLSAVRFNYVQPRFPPQSEKCIQYPGLNCRGLLFSHFCLSSHHFSAPIFLSPAPATKGFAIFIHLFSDYSLWAFLFHFFLCTTVFVRRDETL